MKTLLNNPRRKRRAFPDTLRSFAITLHFYNEKAYNYVRETFLKCLPHPKTLGNWYRKIECKTGINQASIEGLRRKVDNIKKEKRLTKVFGNLTMDEMKIKKSNEGDYGYIDFGKEVNSENVPEAEQALVLMVVLQNSSGKIPISYYFITSLTEEEKAAIVKKNLEVLHETGITMTSVTYDGLNSNNTMSRKLGVNTSDLSKPYFLHPITKEKVFIVCDPSHVIKLLRNSLASGEDMFDGEGNLISWDHVVQLNKYQNEMGLSAGTKLTDAHIRWFEDKMRVKLAAQTLSKSVGDALMYLKESKVPGFEDVQGTAKFCYNCNDGFDILNSRSPYDNRVHYKNPFSEKNIEDFTAKSQSIISYISKIRYKDEKLLTLSRKKAGFVGMMTSLRSAISICNTYYKQVNGYLLTYKLSQDHLESFFSAVRSKGGHSNNPTCFQFVTRFKRLLIHADVKGSENANCIALDDTEIIKIPEEIWDKAVNQDDKVIYIIEKSEEEELNN